MAKKILSVIIMLIIISTALTSCIIQNGSSANQNEGNTQVTREEWDSLFQYTNYTAEGNASLGVGSENARLLYKIDGTSQSIEYYNDNSVLLSGKYYAMINGTFYEIEKSGNSYIGYKSDLDNVYRNFFDSYDFTGMYDEFEYDNEKQAYFFENDYASCYLYVNDKKIIRMKLTVNSNDDLSMDVKFTYYGETEVSIPEFDVENEESLD